MSEQHTAKRILRKILKIVVWIILSLVLLLVSIALIIQIPSVQKKLTQRAISFLEKKIGTTVTLKSISIAFPKAIVIKGLYLEDQKKDTLLYAGRLSVDTDLWALTKNEIQLNTIGLEDFNVNINRQENDSAFNFSYILKAFTSDTVSVKDTTNQKSWKFSIEDIALKKINAKYNDLLTGNIIDFTLGSFEVSLDEFDLDTYKIIVDKISLSDSRANVLQTKLPTVTEEVAEENQPFTYDIGVGKIMLKNVHATYTQQALGQIIRLDLGESELETERIDLKSNKIELNDFSLKKTFISYQQHHVANTDTESVYDPEPVAEKKSAKSKPWKISLASLTLERNSIQYYDFTKPQQPDAIDFNHLWLSNLGIEANDIILNGTEVACYFKNLSFQEKSGFTIKTFRADIHLKEKTADVNKLLLITGNSRMEADAHAAFSSFGTIAETYPQAKIKTTITETSIAWRDVLYFNPALKDSLPVKIPANARVRVTASLEGMVKNLKLNRLVIQTLSDTYLRTSGTIAGLPEMQNLKMNIALDKFFTTKYDLNQILSDSLVPATIDLPGWLNIQGDYTGSLNQSAFKTKLTSNIGAVGIHGKMNLDSTSNTRGYEATMAINDFHVGKLLKQPEKIGKLNMNAALHAKGLTPKEMTGTIETTIHDFDFQGYLYENFNLHGDIKNQLFTGTASLNDENLNFEFEGDVNYREEVPRYNFTLELKNIDVKALHLSEKPLKARGTLNVNMATSDFKKLNGNIGLRKVALYNGDALYAVDSLLFASIDQDELSEVRIDSDILTGNFRGSFNLVTLPQVLQEYFGSYYSLHDSTTEKKDSGRQYFKFDVKLHKTDILTDILIPQLTQFVPGQISGEFDSERKHLDVRIDIESIQYANMGVKSFTLNTNANASRLNYNIFIDEIMVDSLRIDGLEFNGTVANDSILTNLIILDSLDLYKYMIGGVFKSRIDEYEFRLLPKQVKLNYEDWAVPHDNFIRFGGEKPLAHNITLANGREQIIIDSKDDAASTLFIGFRELNLEYLVSMISKDKAVSGLLHGDIFLIPEKNNMSFTANIGIDNFSMMEIPWGDISLAVERKTANRFDVVFGLQGSRNDIKAQGYYATGEKPIMDIKTTIAQLDLASIEPLSMGQLKNLKGLLTGNIDLQGSPQQPSITGDLTFRNTQFVSTYLKSGFSLKNETISLTREGISFNNFEVLDDYKNTARIDGAIVTNDYKNFAFRLNLDTDNFRLLNTTENDNDLFYGKIDINASVKVRGTMLHPKIDMRIGLSENSHLTYIVQQSEAGVMEQDGVVKFVDKTFKDDPFMTSINPKDTVKSTFTGLDLTARIELNDKESFTVVIDPITQDQLTVKGNATLLLEIDPTGDIQLAGRYEISEGTYNLSFYKFVKREFNIEKGSTMTWSGDPLNAQMNVHALFNVETAPIDLISSQLGTNDPQILNKYKERLPFIVYLDIEGELLNPEISFRLDMPMRERNKFTDVYTKLQDINTRESDLNKQVFALLILKRFISDNPLENQGAGGFEGTARTSVSRILTEQLNRLSENIKGVELSFDLKSYEDYSSGQAQGNTKLQLGLSKNLFNDRLVVKLSGNLDIEGENTNREVTDYIGDLALEYKLTDDGRFRLTGFRNSDYDMIDGELIETGVGVIYVKDYNVLSELFKANVDEKKKK
jgi:translocation and assembly module TamB